MRKIQNKMKIKNTKFKELKIISSKVHKDRRGYFRELFKKNACKRKICFYLCFIF